MDIILACWKSLLKDNNNTWVIDYIDKFDVNTESFDSAQIADRVGVYILDMLGQYDKFTRNPII